MSKNKTLDEIEKVETPSDNTKKKEKVSKPFYRVKDIDGEIYDFATLEEVAETLEFNKGFVKRLIAKKQTFMGVKIYIVK